MRQQLSMDLPRLGPRHYVQGGTVFNAMLEACDRSFGREWLTPKTVLALKLEREATTNGYFVVADEPITDLDPNTTFSAKGPRNLFGCFVEEGRETPREPYDEEQYNRPLAIRGDLSGEFALPGPRPRVDFIKGIVGANKLLHQKSERFGGPLQKIQFLYCRGIEGICLLANDAELHLNIANLFVEERGPEVWTINRVSVTGPSFRTDFRLCYRALKSQG